MGCSSICVSLDGIVDRLVCLCTQFFLFQKHLQYKPTEKAITQIAETEVPLVANIFTFIEGQELLVYVLSFVSVQVMLIIDTCFISQLL